MKRWLAGQLAHGVDKDPRAGYTLTEVIVVLAVTTLLFSAIAITFRGRQARTEFTQAVRNFEAKLQNTVSDVANGFYDTGFSCNVTEGVNNGSPVVGAATAERASQEKCIFIGKNFFPVPSNNRQSAIQTLVGRRTTEPNSVGFTEVETLAEARPVLVNAIQETYVHTYQLRVERMVRIGSGGTVTVYAAGFVNQLSRGVASAQSGGSDLVRLYGLVNSASMTASGNIVNLTNFVAMPQGILICLLGQNDQRAQIRIGDGRSQTTVFSTLDTGATCQ